MPLYEYTCELCRHEWEEVQKMNSPATLTCPDCGAERAKRLISASSFRLTGPGWASDGYSKR